MDLVSVNVFVSLIYIVGSRLDNPRIDQLTLLPVRSPIQILINNTHSVTCKALCCFSFVGSHEGGV